MLGKRRSISQNNELHSSTSNRHIHTAQIIQETDLSVLIGTNQTNQNHIPFLTLKAIHGVYRDVVTERFKESILLDQLTEVLHLCLVRRNETEIDTLVQQAFLANLVDLFLQFLDAEVCFSLVDTSEIFTHEFLVAIHTIGVHPYDGSVEIKYTSILHFGCRIQGSMIEPIR